MGNDGGTIARRSDLVHTKQAAKTSLDIDPRLVARNTFASCALSRLPLRLPVVGDGLGNLYRKDKLVEFLLKKAELQPQLQLNNLDKVNEMAVAGHLRGLKDVKALNMTESTTNKSKDSSSADPDSTTFICPLTSKVMNGSTGRFLYIRNCGCVMSESGLRAVAGNQASSSSSSSSKKSSPPSSRDDQDSSEPPASEESTIPCPVCSTPFNASSLSKSSHSSSTKSGPLDDNTIISTSTNSPPSTSSSETIPPLFSIGSDLIPIFPSTKELDWLKSKMEKERESEKQKKKKEKKTKTKTKSPEDDDASQVEINKSKSVATGSEKKRSATQASLDDPPSSSTDPKVQKITASQQGPQTAAQRLALEARQRTEEKKKGSEALRNLYGEDEFGKKKVGKQQESWMTKGTFTRYA